MDTILGSSINLRQGKTWYDGSQMKDFKDRASIIEMINGHEPMTIILVQLGYEDPYSHPIPQWTCRISETAGRKQGPA